MNGKGWDGNDRTHIQDTRAQSTTCLDVHVGGVLLVVLVARGRDGQHVVVERDGDVLR